MKIKSILYLSLLFCMVSGGAEIDTGLIAYYSFDSEDVAADCSGNGYDGVIKGPVQKVEGIKGNGMLFGGKAELVVDAFTYYHWKTNFAVSFWYSCDEMPGSLKGLINNGYGRRASWEIIAAPRDFGMAIMAGINFESDISFKYFNALPLRTGKWEHIVLSYDGTLASFYWNGNLVNAIEGKSSKIFSKRLPLVLGNTGPSGEAGEYFVGRMDEVRIYDRPLSPLDVSELFNQEPGREIAECKRGNNQHRKPTISASYEDLEIVCCDNLEQLIDLWSRGEKVSVDEMLSTTSIRKLSWTRLNTAKTSDDINARGKPGWWLKGDPNESSTTSCRDVLTRLLVIWKQGEPQFVYGELDRLAKARFDRIENKPIAVAE